MSKTLCVGYRDLSKALKLCVPIVSKNIKNPHILLTVLRDQVTLEATNGNLMVCYTIVAESNFTGQLLLPPRILHAVKAETGGDVKISPYSENTIEVVIGEDRWEFPTEDPAEYPVVNWSSGSDGSVSSVELCEAIKFVEHAMDRDSSNSKYALNGICLDIEWSSKVWVQATDGRRIAFTYMPLADEAEENKTGRRQAIIPAANLSTLKALCAMDERVEIVEIGDQLQFRANSVTLISKLMEGRFPNVRNTAKELKTDPFATIAANELYQTVQAAAVCADAETHGVMLAFVDAETPYVTASCVSTNGKSDSRGWCLSLASEQKLTLSTGYLLDALKNMGEATVSLRCNEQGTTQIVCANGVVMIAGIETQ